MMEGRKTHGMCNHSDLEISFLLRYTEVLLVYPGRLVKRARWPMSLCSYWAGKRTGDRPSFTAAKPKHSSADTSSTWAVAGAASRGRFSLPSFGSPHNETHRWGRLRALEDTAQGNFISKSTAAHCSEGKTSLLKIRDHRRCIKRQDRSVISRSHNCTLHNSKY